MLFEKDTKEDIKCILFLAIHIPAEIILPLDFLSVSSCKQLDVKYEYTHIMFYKFKKIFKYSFIYKFNKELI